MSRVFSALHETACSKCGRLEVLTAGSPGQAVCRVCWESVQPLTPEEALLVLEGLRLEVECPVCSARAGCR